MIPTQSIYWQVSTLIAGGLLTALVLALGHWFPWTRNLNRIEAYIYGVASIIAGYATWRFLNHDWRTVLGLATIAIIAGLTVVIAYKIDGFVIAIRQADKARNCDEELKNAQ